MEQARVHRGLAGFNDPATSTSTSTRRATRTRRTTRSAATYSFNYDVLRSRLLQQRITGFYNAQCCGLAFEYQIYNFSGLATVVAAVQDHRFFMSFTLAGLGNFSPFNGALCGAPR